MQRAPDSCENSQSLCPDDGFQGVNVQQNSYVQSTMYAYHHEQRGQKRGEFQISRKSLSSLRCIFHQQDCEQMSIVNEEYTIRKKYRATNRISESEKQRLFMGYFLNPYFSYLSPKIYFYFFSSGHVVYIGAWTSQILMAHVTLFITKRLLFIGSIFNFPFKIMITNSNYRWKRVSPFSIVWALVLIEVTIV